MQHEQRASHLQHQGPNDQARTGQRRKVEERIVGPVFAKVQKEERQN
jgi:hypothetical protein